MIKTLFAEIKHMFMLCLTVKNLGVLMIVTIIDSFATAFLSPIFGPFLHSKGINLVEIGFIFSLAAVLPLLLQPIMGELSDRIGRKILMVGTSFLTAIVTPLYVFFNSAWFIGVIQATNVTIERSAQPARSAMLADVAPEKERATVFATLGSINDLAYGGALFLGGLLLAGLTVAGYSIFRPLSMTSMFWLAAICYIIASVIMLIFLKETAPAVEQQEQPEQKAQDDQQEQQPEPADQTEQKQRFSRLRAYFGLFTSVFAQSRTMRGLLLFHFLFSCAIGVYFIYVPLLAIELGAPRSWLGPIIALSWLTFAVVQPIGGRLSDRRQARKVFMVWGLIVLAICNLGVALSRFLVGSEPVSGPGLALVIMIIFWALLGIPDAISRPCTSALVVDIVSPKERGRVFGVLGSVTTLGSIVSPIYYGFLAEYVGVWSTFLASSIALAGASFVIAAMVKEKKSSEPAPAEPGATSAESNG